MYGKHDNFNLEDSHVLPGLMHKVYLAQSEFEVPIIIIIRLINHFLEEKNTQKQPKPGLKWPEVSKKRREEFTGIEEGFN